MVYDIDKDGLKDLVYSNGFNATNSVGWFKNTTMVTATKDFQIPTQYKLFPNPASNLINITFEDLPVERSYSIKAIDGKTMSEGISTGGLVDITALRRGIYFLVFKNSNLQFKLLKV
jgi:hypothetical protein